MSQLAHMGPAPRWAIKFAAWSLVVTLALMALLLPLVDPSYFVIRAREKMPPGPNEIRQIRFDSHVKRVKALKAHRELARRCAAAVRKKAPQIASNGRPTLIHLTGTSCDTRCLSAQAYSEERFAVWKAWGLNSIRVHSAGISADEAGLQPLEVPGCAALVSERYPSTRLVLDRKGQLFFAGEEENRLKARLSLPGPNAQPSPDVALADQGTSILLESGKTLHYADAVQIVTWARVCKWHLGECLAVAKEQRAVQRLDETSAEKLVEAGQAVADRPDHDAPR